MMILHRFVHVVHFGLKIIINICHGIHLSSHGLHFLFKTNNILITNLKLPFTLYPYLAIPSTIDLSLAISSF